jgi:DNA-binding NarL/FixJ family response regulator
MIKVGIVEDNKTLREGFETLINRTPEMQCICACGTVGDALKEIPPAAPDVVLMDIQLPDGTGIDCTARIKEQLPNVQIIVVTVYADADWIFQALQAGASGYLLKRATPTRIIEAIREAQEGGVPMTPEIARKVIGQFQAPIKAAEEVESLTPRETEVLQFIMHGLANKEIADRMSISVNSVKWHLRHIYEKLHVRSRVEAVLKYKNQQNPE